MNCQSSADVLAVIVHAYYVDVFAVILKSLKVLDVPMRVYVTTVVEHEAAINKVLIQSGLDYYLQVVSNRGRDILPFLRVMDVVYDYGHVVLLKLHTKKSKHRIDGDDWMGSILNKLINEYRSRHYFDLIKSDSSIGIIAPADHILEMSKYFGENKKNVLHIVKRLGLCESEVKKQVFVAGTMFYAHVDAIQPIMRLALTSDDFEVENNQKDGTLAHAIERCFGISCNSANLKLISSDNVADGVPQFTQDKYAYADATGFSENASKIEVVSFYLFRMRRFASKLINIIFRD